MLQLHRNYANPDSITSEQLITSTETLKINQKQDDIHQIDHCVIFHSRAEHRDHKGANNCHVGLASSIQ